MIGAEPTVEFLSTLETLGRLEPHWRALWAASSHATPFQAPHWLLPWCRHFGEGSPRVLALWDEGRLAGIAPLYVDHTRTLRLMGGPQSDYLDVLCASDFSEALASAIAGALDRWPEVVAADFPDMPPHSVLLSGLPAPQGWRIRKTQDSVCPFLQLPIPAARLARTAYYRRRLARLGAIEFQSADPGTLAPLLDALFALHAARWATRGGPGALANPATQSFHRQSAASFLQAGALRLHALRFEGRVVAVFYGHRHGARLSYYLGGFNPAFEKFSVGSLLVGLAIEAAQKEGAREFDFLRGAEPYKYMWGATDRHNARVRLWKS